MARQRTSEQQIELAKNFLRTLDKQGDMFALVTDDIEMVFPKWGVARGKAELARMFQDLGGYVAAITHDPKSFICMAGDGHVCIEGVSAGTLTNGKTWKPDGANAGRFCTVLEFEDSLIKRARIHLDPDYADSTEREYHWRRPVTRC